MDVQAILKDYTTNTLTIPELLGKHHIGVVKFYRLLDENGLPRRGYSGNKGRSHVRKVQPDHDRDIGKQVIAEAAFETFAASQNWSIYPGRTGKESCDYIVDADGELLRVEVKYAGAATSPKVASEKFNFVFVFTDHGNYWIPANGIATASLHISNPNGRNAGARREYLKYLIP
jgi:hypothetical protein